VLPIGDIMSPWKHGRYRVFVGSSKALSEKNNNSKVYPPQLGSSNEKISHCRHVIRT
jgi:hypothetical protein